MNDEDLRKIEVLSLNIKTDLCILKNAMKNNHNNTLEIGDLISFVERTYSTSDEVLNIFVKAE